jgi:thiamine biosynthesis lipoprotein
MSGWNRRKIVWKSVIVGQKALQLSALAPLLLMLVGCAGIMSPSQNVAVKRAQMHMGTLVTITAVAPDLEAGHKAIQAGFNEIKRLERLLSTWIPESELSQVNAESGRRPVAVSRETWIWWLDRWRWLD